MARHRGGSWGGEGYHPGMGLDHEGHGAGERVRDRRSWGQCPWHLLTIHVYHSSDCRVRKDYRSWVEGEASPRTQRLRCFWNSPQQPTNTERKTDSALSGHFTCRKLIVILKGVVPQRGVGISNRKDGPKESSLCQLPG